MDRCLVTGLLLSMLTMTGCSSPRTFVADCPYQNGSFAAHGNSDSHHQYAATQRPGTGTTAGDVSTLPPVEPTITLVASEDSAKEICEPLIQAAPVPPANLPPKSADCTNNAGTPPPSKAPRCKNSGCTDSGCTGEGCGGCTGEADYRRRRSNLDGGFVRGKKNILLDGAGWVAGIPSKLLLWNTKVDSHSVSPETEQQLRQYLASRGLHDVKVRVNQYDPVGEWKRLIANKDIHAGWRYTVGAFAVSKYTLLPGRLFGNDEYNPFTNSISLFSDQQSIALREGAHASQAINAPYRGLYSASMYLPASPLWVDTTATREVLAYARETNQQPLERETYLVLFPSYGARIGQSMTLFIDAGQGAMSQAGFAMVGHAVGRTMAYRVSETPMQMVKSVYGIVKRPQEDDTAPQETAEVQNPLPDGDDYHLSFVPIEVGYGSSDEKI